ncbi:MAG: lipoyl(octanoyl) transferase LipB [Thermoplasmataceae archaeon]|jgi:lipoyl(octanoyl) transferase|nr:lipoyl(octanoyl) transferase LipB [Candidatus Thermoplasmatota archaeon]
MILNLGTMEYGKTLSIQRKLNNLRNESRIDDCMIVVEHPDVYTAGIHWLPGPEQQEIDVVRIERGGSITYHGPGQLVTYYIINLRERNLNVLNLIEILQNCNIDLLEQWSIPALPRLGKETGVWTGSRKIASIGLALKGFSTLHGCALNVSTDLGGFNRINPCDFSPDIMTSMENETGYSISMDSVREKYMRIASEKLNIGDVVKNRDSLDYINELLSETVL